MEPWSNAGPRQECSTPNAASGDSGAAQTCPSCPPPWLVTPSPSHPSATLEKSHNNKSGRHRTSTPFGTSSLVGLVLLDEAADAQAHKRKQDHHSWASHLANRPVRHALSPH